MCAMPFLSECRQLNVRAKVLSTFCRMLVATRSVRVCVAVRNQGAVGRLLVLLLCTPWQGVQVRVARQGTCVPAGHV